MTARRPKGRVLRLHTRQSTIASRIYVLKVAIEEVAPAIWRRIEIQSDTKLSLFHEVLQLALGWTDSHLHEFRVGDRRIGTIGVDPEYEQGLEDEDEYVLGEILLQSGDRLVYAYDFGDGWEHEVALEEIHPAPSGPHAPRCLGGERACPPDDCGGPRGYADLLAALKDPNHPQHEELANWVQYVKGTFDPAAFDLEAVNTHLADLKQWLKKKAELRSEWEGLF
jgi:hypothetical protein